MHPVTTSRSTPLPFRPAISRMVSIDSCFAASMNPQVLTMTTSACWRSLTIVTSVPCPSCPSMTSASTRFFGQPREIIPTRLLMETSTTARSDPLFCAPDCRRGPMPRHVLVQPCVHHAAVQKELLVVARGIHDLQAEALDHVLHRAIVQIDNRLAQRLGRVHFVRGRQRFSLHDVDAELARAKPIHRRDQGDDVPVAMAAIDLGDGSVPLPRRLEHVGLDFPDESEGAFGID